VTSPHLNEDGSPASHGHPQPNSFGGRVARRLRILWEQNVALFSGPLAKYTLLVCFIDFGIMSR
jgi:hypothetical protein